MSKGSLVFAQSGGPTAVINASALGVIQEASKNSTKIDNIYCCKYGISGLLKEELIDVSSLPKIELDLLYSTPASAFGSCRMKLPDYNVDETPYQKIKQIFAKYNVKYFVYNGGNDSMDTCCKIDEYFRKINFDCSVIGVPKTIDNDLLSCDHTPGYPSAIKYIATTFCEMAMDTTVYEKGKITLVEVMGRNTGWLTAGSALSTYITGNGPDLIYLPERAFDFEKFINDVCTVYNNKGSCLVALSEGIQDENGKYVSEYIKDKNQKKDEFSHINLEGAGRYLSNLLVSKTNLPLRNFELSLTQRSAAHLASLTDVKEAYKAGCMAVKAILNNKSGYMVTLVRAKAEPYRISFRLVLLSSVANKARLVPQEYINAEGNFVTQKFVDYALPLIKGESKVTYLDGLPRYSKISQIIKTR